jgi:hypothetical protein
VRAATTTRSARRIELFRAVVAEYSHHQLLPLQARRSAKVPMTGMHLPKIGEHWPYFQSFSSSLASAFRPCTAQMD